MATDTGMAIAGMHVVPWLACEIIPTIEGFSHETVQAAFALTLEMLEDDELFSRNSLTPKTPKER
jgi:hypothetical protein